jgi:hypothetical protein
VQRLSQLPLCYRCSEEGIVSTATHDNIPLTRRHDWQPGPATWQGCWQTCTRCRLQRQLPPGTANNWPEERLGVTNDWPTGRKCQP